MHNTIGNNNPLQRVMKKTTSLILTWFVVSAGSLALIGGANALSVESYKNKDCCQTERTGCSSRRFFMTSAASILSVALVAPETPPANAAFFDFFNKQEEEEFTYDIFKNLVQSNKIKSVEFSWDGSIMTCIDMGGKKRSLEGIPDDPTLLVSLVDAGIEPVVDEFPFEKRMSSTGWFRDSVLNDDTLTDEEKYKYRGYKTYRQNIPENRVYIRSDLISN